MKVAYIFKVFGAQSCLMVALGFARNATVFRIQSRYLGSAILKFFQKMV